MGIRNKYSLLFFFLAALFFIKVNAQRTDVVILDNGDHITGEVKKLEYGMLTFKTDDAGTILIEWKKISKLSSVNTYEVELIDGSINFGSLLESAKPKILIIGNELFRFEFVMDSVVMIHPIKNRFWTRIDGSVNIGFNYTKASSLAQMNFDANASYRARQYLGAASYSGTFTAQPEKDDTKRQDLNFSFSRMRKNKWFYITQLGFQQNSELGLILRTSLSAGTGRNTIQTNKNVLSFNSGLSANRELKEGLESAETNLEAYLQGSYTFFIYETPKSDISILYTIYPGITDWGRIRYDGSINLSQEIVKDFKITLSFKQDFDNQPAEGASKSDYNLVLSVGYTF